MHHCFWKMQVCCHVVKLVLRNNALTTLRGIENLKSLEGLDVSCNIISNFSELEFIVGLSFLQSVWLEGNPLCCARWYRAQVFSYFSHPENLKLDDKEINTTDYWKRKIIVASRQKRPSSFGFYSPAKDDAEAEGCIKKKRVCKVSPILWFVCYCCNFCHPSFPFTCEMVLAHWFVFLTHLMKFCCELYVVVYILFINLIFFFYHFHFCR